MNQKSTKPSRQFWLLSTFLICVFLTGGASRADVESLVILRPASVIMCALAILTLHRKHFEQRKWLFAGFATLMALAALHLLRLPPFILQSVPGRQVVTAVNGAIGHPDVWRPFTMAPVVGWNALVSLFTPLAALLFGIQLSREDLYRLLPLLIGLGALSGIFGLLQIIGSPEGPLYFYRLTNNGSAVGLFANRNHAATFLACLFPMLAVFASTADGTADRQRRRQLWAAAFAIVLVPLILVTGSRSGLIVAMIGLAISVLLYRRPVAGRTVRRGDSRWAIGAMPVLVGLAVICLGLITVLFSRAKAVDRLFEGGSGNDNRSDFWAASVDLFWRGSFGGSGSGSFATVFLIAEPDHLLDSSYLNRAHNDWIESAVTFGFPFILLVAIATALYLRRLFKLLYQGDGKRRSVSFSRMAGLLIAMVAAASVVDYPLRTPSMMCMFAIVALWFTEAGRGTSPSA